MADHDDSERLLEQAAQGNRECLGALLDRHRDRLVRMVALRLDDRLRGRLDPSDVIQEAYLEASVRLPEYFKQPAFPFFLWLRGLTGQKLVTLHRHHLGVNKRDAGLEVRMDPGGAPATTSAALAACLMGREPRPSEMAVRDELELRYQMALETLDTDDREILALRHFEQLTNSETARVLGLQESAASKRYIRAVQRLQDAMGEAPSENQ